MKLKTNFTFNLNDDGTVKSAFWSYGKDTDYYYGTNSCGEGIFLYHRSAGSVKQLTGTCQFSIYRLKPNSARAKINKWFS